MTQDASHPRCVFGVHGRRGRATWHTWHTVSELRAEWYTAPTPLLRGDAQLQWGVGLAMLGKTKRSGQINSPARANKRQRAGHGLSAPAESAVEAAAAGATTAEAEAQHHSEGESGSSDEAGGLRWPGAANGDSASDTDASEGPEEMDVQYAGFRVPAAVPGHHAWRVPRVDIAEVSSDPEWFWREYVCRRKPVVICGLLSAPVRGGGDAAEGKQNGSRASGAGAGAGAGGSARSSKPGSDSKASSASGSEADAGAGGGTVAYEPCFAGWTNAMLRRTAGDALVSVERRDGPTDRFGRGVKVQMKFSEFLGLLEAGDENHYLPAQELPVDDDGEGVGLFAPPMDSLARGLPWRPHIVPFLVPQQLNMWMGNARDGSSSGLHHDYHDNLYVLLRGRKRFTIFSPADAGAMDVNGRIRLVHPNGLITYQGAPSLRADGVAADAVAEERRKLAEERLALAEAQLEKAERAAAGGSKRGKQRDESEHKGGAEARVAAARAAVAAAEEEIENALEAALTAQLEQAIGGAADEVDMEYDESASGGSDAGGSTGGMEPSANPGVASADPQSFSRIDTADLHGADLSSKYPAAAAAHRGEAMLDAGDMLFLPAGWFHEVRPCPCTPLPRRACAYPFHPRLHLCTVWLTAVGFVATSCCPVRLRRLAKPRAVVTLQSTTGFTRRTTSAQAPRASTTHTSTRIGSVTGRRASLVGVGPTWSRHCLGAARRRCSWEARVTRRRGGLTLPCRRWKQLV